MLTGREALEKLPDPYLISFSGWLGKFRAGRKGDERARCPKAESLRTSEEADSSELFHAGEKRAFLREI